MTSGSAQASPASSGYTPGGEALLHTWAIPLTDGSALDVPALAGEVAVFVGANGAGKSALSYWLQRNTANVPLRRIIAHRRLWLNSAGPDITASVREQRAPTVEAWNHQPDSRWLDHADSVRSNIVLFDFLGAENERNARLASLYDSRTPPEVIDAKVETSPLRRLNDLLLAAGLRIKLSLTVQGSLEVEHQDRPAVYPASQMSDGEKGALLLAAEVLTSPPSSLLVIDEPERHLHRAISADLIGAVIKSRPDCSFVVMTHDLDLARVAGSTSGTLYVVADCQWSGQLPTAWTMHRVEGEIPETARSAVLGGRTKILFVEGEGQSIDTALYGLLFPGWTAVPSGGCESVIRAVTGLGLTSQSHWVKGRGIVDGDGRSSDEIATLRAKGVLVLPVSEVESLIYQTIVIKAVASLQGELLERDPEKLSTDAVDAALAALNKAGVAERLAAFTAQLALQRAVTDRLPGRDELAKGASTFTVTAPSPYPAKLAAIKAALAAADLDEVARIAPIRDSQVPDVVWRKLRFGFRRDYEAAARGVIARDAHVRNVLVSLVGQLP